MSLTIVSYKTRKAFLDELAKGYSESRAARQAGTTVKTMTTLAEEDPNFKADWDDSLKQGLHRLEDHAHKRALQGSDSVLMFLLKARDRKKYGDQQKVEHAGQIDFGDVDAKLNKKFEALERAEAERQAKETEEG